MQLLLAEDLSDENKPQRVWDLMDFQLLSANRTQCVGKIYFKQAPEDFPEKMDFFLLPDDQTKCSRIEQMEITPAESPYYNFTATKVINYIKVAV